MRAKRQIARKIKPSLRRPRQRTAKLPFPHRTYRKPRTRQTHVQNLLPRYPITLRKHRPQALVPLDNVPKRSFQRPNIQITTQPNRQRDRVPRTTTFQPLQKPQPTLRKRQRNFRRTLNGPQRRARNSSIPKSLNKQRHRRRFKQAADRYLNFKARPHPADQTRRQKRVTAKREEVILNPDPLNPQHLRKQPAQNLLTRRARQPQTAPPNRRRRQRCAVKLPVRRQRQTFKLNNRRRNHVIRKPRPHVRAQLPSINRTASRRHHIANKLRAPRPFTARNHRSLRHTRMTPQRRLNLPRLNAKTANLHLMVRTTHKLQNSIRPPPRQVPAAVHPSPRSPKPVRNKALPSQPTAANIAATYPTAGYVKLPNYPNSHRLKAIIQNIHAVIRQRTANRDMRTRLLAFDSKSNGIDRRFRRTVKIGDLLEREAARNLSHKLYRQGLPTQGQMLQRRIGRGTADDRVQVGRHAAHETHLFPDQSMPELRGRLPYRIADNHRRPATDERQHRLLNRGVKSTRDDERRSETAPHVEVLRQAQDLISEACMSDGDALGGSGGA